MSLGRTFGRLFVAGAGILAAAGVGSLLSGSIDEAREAQKVGAQTDAVLKSTGGTANVTAKSIGLLAQSLSAKIGVDDEAIQAGENMLLTFTNVRNEFGKGNQIFAEATKTVQDMAAAFGGDAVSNSKILGKALNDPTKGVSALTRVGVTFTDKQKEQIKTFQESGNILGAQKIILKELAKETKGSAEAQATAGDKARVAFGNLKETIGTALLPVIDKLANLFTSRVAPAITAFIGQLKSGEGVGGKVAAVFSAVTGAIGGLVGQMRSGEGPGGVLASIIQTLVSYLGTLFTFVNNNRAAVGAFVGIIAGAVLVAKAFAAAQLLVNVALSANPIGIVVVAIAALVAGLIYAYKHSETFAAIVDKSFSVIKKVISAVIGFVVPFVKKHWQLLVTIIGGPLAFIVIQVVKHFDTIKKVVGVAVDFVVGQAKQFGKFASLVIEHVGKVVKFFRELPGKIKGFLTGLPGELKKIGGDIIQGLVNGIKGAAHYVTDAVQDIINKIPKKIRSLMHIGSPSKVTEELGGFIGEGLAKGIAGSSERVGQAVEKVGKKLKEKLAKIRDQLSTARSDFASLVEPIASNFTQGLFGFDTASAFTANLATVKGTLTTLLGNFKKLIGEGLKPAFLYQLFQEGGPGLINSLAGLPAADAQAAGGLFSDVMSLSDQLGSAVAGSTDKGAALENQTQRLEKRLKAIEDAVKKNGKEVGREINGAASSGRRRAA